MKAYITCGLCGGKGRIELTGEYHETLCMLRREREEITGAALGRKAGIAPTAMCNRLVALEKHGLAVGRWFGRKRLWRAT